MTDNETWARQIINRSNMGTLADNIATALDEAEARGKRGGAEKYKRFYDAYKALVESMKSDNYKFWPRRDEFIEAFEELDGKSDVEKIVGK